MGAWIETTQSVFVDGQKMSHPTWVRGLKPRQYPSNRYYRVSHPTWVRGLKLLIKFPFLIQVFVAPYMGAWIETNIKHFLHDLLVKSHPTWVRGLKLLTLLRICKTVSRTLHGCVD